MPANPTNGTPATASESNGSMADVATPFSPISQDLNTGMNALAMLLLQTREPIEQINDSASEVTVPSASDLRKHITDLGRDIAVSKLDQNADFEALTDQVDTGLKHDIKRQLDLTIRSAITTEVNLRVKDKFQTWAKDDRLPQSLENIFQENEGILKASKITLDNSKARRLNSPFNEVRDYESKLAVIKNSRGAQPEGDMYPKTLKMLFSYNDAQVERLLQFYGLVDCRNKVDNLNRFLAFIGIRFSLPEQPAFLLVEPTPPGRTTTRAGAASV